jgi:hypothetical protein
MKTQGSNIVSEPGRPRPGTSGIWNQASSEAIVISGSRAQVVPPPIA